MNIAQLEHVAAVVRYGGIHRAAASLHVTPQAVSVSIKRLEAELGVELFERSGREMLPTSAGHDVAQRATVILAALDDLKGVVSGDAPGVSPDGHFRLYVPGLYGRGSVFSDEAYDRFVEQEPSVHLDVWHQPSASCAAALHLGIADAAIVLERMPRDGLDYRELGTVPLVLLTTCGARAAEPFVRAAHLSSHLLAMPINLSACLAILGMSAEVDVAALRFRDVPLSYDAQHEFLREGGAVLALKNSQLEAAFSDVCAFPIRGAVPLAMPVYYCCRHGEWTDRQQLLYWFALDALGCGHPSTNS